MKILVDTLLEGDIEQINTYLEYEMDIDQLCSNGESPLHILIHPLTGSFGWNQNKTNQKFGENHIKIFEALLAAGVQINTQDKNGQTVLHRLSATNNRKFLGGIQEPTYSDVEVNAAYFLITLLIQKKVILDIADHNNKTALQIAIESGNEVVALQLLEAGAMAQNTNSRNNMLQIACGFGFISIVEKLLALSIPYDDSIINSCHDLDIKLIFLNRGVELPDDEKISLLQWAAHSNHEPMLTYLITNGITKIRNSQGLTALHCINNNFGWVKRLVENGAEINARAGTAGFTPLLNFILEQSCRQETSNAVIQCQWMVEHGADVTVRDQQGNTALHLLVNCFNLNQELVEYLLRQGIDINALNLQGEAALHRAVFYNLKFCNLLLNLRADPNQQDTQNLFALEKLQFQQNYTGTEEDIHVIRRLLSYYPALQLPKNTMDLLKVAITSNSIELAEDLINRGLVISNISEFNPIMLILTNCFQTIPIKMIRWLTEQGIDLNCIDHEMKLTPLQYIVRRGFFDTVQDFLAMGADPCVKNGEEQTLLHEITVQGCMTFSIKQNKSHKEQIPKFFRFVKNLIGRGVDIDHKDKNRCTALDLALTRYPYIPACEVLILIQCGASLPVELKLIENLLRFALNNDVIWIVERILEEGNQSSKSRYIEIILEYHISPKIKDLLIEMIKGKYSISLSEKHKCSQKIVVYVIGIADLGLIEILLGQGLDINASLTINDREQRLIEHAFCAAIQATQSGQTPPQYIDMINLLINQGCELHFPISYARYLGNQEQFDTCLHVAVRFEWLSVIETLIEHGFPINLVSSQSTALSLAVAKGNVAITQLFIKKGADARVKTASGQTLLHKACAQGNQAMISLLLDCGLDVNAVCSESCAFLKMSMTPLDYILELKGALAVKENLVQILLTRSARIKNNHILTAIRLGFNNKLIETFIQSRSPLVMKQLCLLHWAIEWGHREMVVWMLAEFPFLLNVRDQRGCTPLHIATKPGREKIFKILCEHGASVSHDDMGYSIAQYAFFFGTEITLQLLPVISFEKREFIKLRLYLMQLPEFSNLPIQDFAIAECCYKLLCLFSTADVAKVFIQRYSKPAHFMNQPIHDLCLFTLPRTEGWDKAVWAQLVLENGNELTKYLHFAPHIEVLLKRPPINFDEIKSIVLHLKYEREQEDVALARLFMQHKIPEAGFNHVLDYYKDYQKGKEADYIPDLYIDGATLSNEGCKNFYLKKLKSNDPRGFILGALTHCCQYVGSNGQNCAMHGMQSAHSGFYAVFKKSKDKDIIKIRTLLDKAEKANSFQLFISTLAEREQKQKYNTWQGDNQFDDATALIEIRTRFKEELAAAHEGELIAQIWVLESEEQGLIFDSWERLRPENDNLCEPFLLAAAEIAVNQFGFSQVLLGKGGNTPENLKFETMTQPHQPKNYALYRDSEEQFLIATRQKPSLTSTSISATVSQTFLAPPQSLTSYTLTQLDALLHHVLQDQTSIMASPSIQLTPKSERSAFTNILQELENIQNTISKSYHTIILPIRYLECWSCIFFEYEQNQWQTTICEPFSDSLREKFSTFQDLPGIKDYNFSHTSACYEPVAAYTGTWVVEIIKCYIKNHRIITPPLMDKEQQRQQQLAIVPSIVENRNKSL